MALTIILLVILTFPLPSLEAGPPYPFFDRAIVNPTVDRGDPPVQERVILACSRIDMDFLAGLTSAAEVAGTVWDCPLLEGSWGGKPVTIAGPIIGAPYAILVMEKLIALGARMVMQLGWCGSLNSQVRIGDLVLPKSAMSGDGTTPYYQPGGLPPRPDQALRQLLRARLVSESVAWHEGPIWSTDAIYRETPSLVRQHQRLGNLAVEMESAALYTVGRYRRVAVATLLVVSDELFTLHWNRGFDSPVFQEARHQAARILLDAAAAWEKTDY